MSRFVSRDLFFVSRDFFVCLDLCLATFVFVSRFVSRFGVAFGAARGVTQSCPPTDQLSRQAKFVSFLQTHREAQRYVPNRNIEKSMISIVRAAPRQLINRRGKPNL